MELRVLKAERVGMGRKVKNRKAVKAVKAGKIGEAEN
jgi:hypothetical protein